MGQLILIVDDDPSARAALAEALIAVGYETASASNGRDAIEFLYGGRRPCLILLDLVMPDMNGSTFYEWLRADRRHSEIPIVLVSGIEPPPELARIERLEKPFDLQRLEETVERLCPRSAEA